MNATEARATMDRITKMVQDSSLPIHTAAARLELVEKGPDGKPAWMADLYHHLDGIKFFADTPELAISLFEPMVVARLREYATSIPLKIRKALEAASRDREGAK